MCLGYSDGRCDREELWVMVVVIDIGGGCFCDGGGGGIGGSVVARCGASIFAADEVPAGSACRSPEAIQQYDFDVQ